MHQHSRRFAFVAKEGRKFRLNRSVLIGGSDKGLDQGEGYNVPGLYSSLSASSLIFFSVDTLEPAEECGKTILLRPANAKTLISA